MWLVDWKQLHQQNLVSCGWSPDLVWIKNTRWGSYNRVLFDTVRGVESGFVLKHNRRKFHWSNTVTSSFNDDGFTLGMVLSQSWLSNSGDHVGWVWDAGEATTTIAAGGSNSLAYDQTQTWRKYQHHRQQWNFP